MNSWVAYEDLADEEEKKEEKIGPAGEMKKDKIEEDTSKFQSSH